jgi:hypothetical protein
MVAASHRFIAHASSRGQGSAVSVLPLALGSGSSGFINGHSSAVNDLCFSPFNDCVLATGAVVSPRKLFFAVVRNK